MKFENVSFVAYMCFIEKKISDSFLLPMFPEQRAMPLQFPGKKFLPGVT